MNLIAMSPPVDEFTFETLTEVYRREQRNKTISEVRKDFYPAMRECLENLKRESEREFAIDQFSTKAKLASNQLMKFQEKSAQVFEFRFGKLMDMALRAAQGAKLETTRLTVEEKEVYDKVYSLLKECRAVVLEGSRPRIVEAEEPSLIPAAAPEMVVEALREESAMTTPVTVTVPAEEIRRCPRLRSRLSSSRRSSRKSRQWWRRSPRRPLRQSTWCCASWRTSPRSPVPGGPTACRRRTWSLCPRRSPGR